MRLTASVGVGTGVGGHADEAGAVVVVVVLAVLAFLHRSCASVDGPSGTVMLGVTRFFLFGRRGASVHFARLKT